MPTPNVYDPDALTLALTHTHTCDMHETRDSCRREKHKKVGVKEIQDTVELEEVTVQLAEMAMRQCANVQSKKSGNFSDHYRFARKDFVWKKETESNPDNKECPPPSLPTWIT